MTTTEHPFAQYVRILGKGKTGSRSLSFDEAKTAFNMILRGEAEDIQVGAFLMLLRVKEESAEEIAGFVAACREFIDAPNHIHVDIDWSSYAGKRRQLPWFIASLTLLADQGTRIFIHGAKGHTAGRLYTEDAFNRLELPVSQSWQDVSTALDNQNITLMPVEAMCAPLARLLSLRNTLGLRSPVHTLCRLINPLNAEQSFQSIFHPAYAATHQQAAAILKQPNMAVFKGEGGEIERKANAASLVKTISSHLIAEEKWPKLQEEKEPAMDSLDMQHFIDVWRGNTQDAYANNAIIGTLAIILKQHSTQYSQEDALAKARDMWNERNLQRFN
ncbi:putative protein YbiB [BD1-7 clade bacterium]|uniref:Anthranilate phosphoribosyltransferase n=1 Tax=BD1-7 clade bacterium TaxID=2029982 RepID=A0A5S9PW09_9GAMM|nr:putative protein YbiB [BD1-7 clade bacterium]CAA0109129.1 putative protein YbiB [BD1-7 clade bacterium]